MAPARSVVASGSWSRPWLDGDGCDVASAMTQAARVDHDGGAELFDERVVRKPGGHWR